MGDTEIQHQWHRARRIRKVSGWLDFPLRPQGFANYAFDLVCGEDSRTAPKKKTEKVRYNLVVISSGILQNVVEGGRRTLFRRRTWRKEGKAFRNS
jgi:hypothetical protein